jgi:hypothetical protein
MALADALEAGGRILLQRMRLARGMAARRRTRMMLKKRRRSRPAVNGGGAPDGGAAGEPRQAEGNRLAKE